MSLSLLCYFLFLSFVLFLTLQINSACRKPPTRSSKDFRCYEFVIGGIVFRDLPTMDDNIEGGSSPSKEDFDNEESAYQNSGKLMSILDVIEPGWRSDGFA